MKCKFLTKLSVAILCIGTIMSTSASAKTYTSDLFSGKDDSSKKVVLGDGTRYIYGDCRRGSGDARATMVVPYSPDSIVASFFLWNQGESGQDEFEAWSERDDEEQQYYIVWKGSTTKSKAWLAMSN